MSVRKWTDFAAEYDRSRAGVRPISMRNRTDVGAEYDRSRRWGRQAEPSSRITCPRASRTPGCPALPRAQPSYADAVTDNASQPRAVLNAPDAPGAAHPGLFISFEGGDGVGKTTQIRILAELLKEAGVECEATREPGGTDLGIEIRRLLLHGDDISPRAEALLYAADRAHHVATRIRPALERGAVVLTDRYLDSSVAYQGVARSLGVDDVRDLSLWATEGLLPDLTILLDAEPDIASRRPMARGATDRLEREPGAFHAALRAQFLALAKGEPDRFVVIDADRPVEAVADDVFDAVRPLLARLPGSALGDDSSDSSGSENSAARRAGER